MKKGEMASPYAYGNSKFVIIIILLTIIIIGSFILINERKVIEKDKGALHNLGNVFSFKWLIGGPVAVSGVGGAGAACTIPPPVLSCLGTRVVETIDMLDCSDCHKVGEVKNYITNCFPYNCLNGVCSTSCSSDSDCGQYSTTTCAVGYDNIPQGNVRRAVCDLNNNQCSEVPLFTTPGWCEDNYKCVASSDPTNINPEIGNAYCEYCGDETINGNENCDLGKFCVGDPTAFEINPALPDEDLLKYGKQRCKDENDCKKFACIGDCSTGSTACEPMDVFACEKQAILSSAGPFSATDDPLVPVQKCISCSKNCKCSGKNYYEEEKKCYDFVDDKENKRKGVKTKKIPFTSKVDATTGKCQWFQEPVLSESTSECGICQSCGNYPLLGGQVFDIDPAPLLSLTSPPGLTIVKNIGSITVTNDDLIDRTMTISGSGDLVLDWGIPSGTILGPGGIQYITVKVKISDVFCGNKYGKIIIKLAGKMYVYNIAVFMKNNCKCGETKKEPPVECLNYATLNNVGGLPYDNEGLKTILQPIITPLPGNIEIIEKKRCRWGNELPLCSAIETFKDFETATGITIDADLVMYDPPIVPTQIQLDEIAEKKLLSLICTCYNSWDDNLKNKLKKIIISKSPPVITSIYIISNTLKMDYLGQDTLTIEKCKELNKDFNLINPPTVSPPSSTTSSTSGGGSGGGSAPAKVSFSSSQLSSGVTQSFSSGQSVGISLPSSSASGLSESHSVSAIIVNNNQATVTIASTPQTKTLSIGEEWKVDVNNDGVYDLLVKLERIENNKPVLSMKTIDETITKINEIPIVPSQTRETETPKTEPMENPKSDLIILIKQIAVYILLVGIIVCVILIIWKPWKIKVKRR